MRIRLSVVCAVLVLMALACGSVFADWTSSELTSTGTTESLLLTPSVATVGSSYSYSYALTNNTANDFIIGFTLVFPTAVPVAEFTSIVTPDGWDALVRTLSNKINWRLGEDENLALKPGETKTFGFTSSLGPGNAMDVNVSCQDSFGFSGTTFGPAVPEPGSLLALVAGISGLAGIKLRRR